MDQESRNKKKRNSYSGLSERTKRRALANDFILIKKQLTNQEPNLKADEEDSINTEGPDESFNFNLDNTSTFQNLNCDGGTSSDSCSPSDTSTDSETSHSPPMVDTNNELMAEQISEWHKRNNITLQATTEILHILHPHHPHLPLDARTLIGTPQTNTAETCAGGSLIYFGLKQNLMKQVSNGLTLSKYPMVEMLSQKLYCPPDKILTVSVNIDGCPLEKSTQKCFWPVICVLDQALGKRKPFVVAIFYGNSKPSSSNEFLKRFVDECLELERDGIIVNNLKFMFRLSCIIADAPARSFLKNIVGHNSLYGCEKCVQEGMYLGRTTWQYQDRKACLRTDELFDKQIYDEHQRSNSPFSVLSIGLISQVPLDFMHLVCLGVVKRLIRVWLERGPKKCRLSSHYVEVVSERLRNINSAHYPREFSRRPRPLSEFKYWKATEFRSFVLYLGPIVLVNVLSESLYCHFLTLHSAIYILCSELSQNMEMVQYANKLLDSFVKYIPALYSKELLIYNVHNLLHISDDVINYGSLDNFSAFPFENLLGQLKKMVRARNRPLQQLANRLLEKVDFVTDSVDKKIETLFRDGTIKSIYLEGGVICKCLNDTSMADSCFITKSKEIVVVRSIDKVKNASYYKLHCDAFEDKSDFYTLPLPSSLLDIVKVKIRNKKTIVLSSSDILKKCHLLPCFIDKTSYVCIPYCNMFLAQK